MLPVLPLGPVSLPVPGLLIILGFALGSWWAERAAPRLGLRAKAVSDVIFYGVLGGVVGARLFMVLRAPEAFRASPRSILSLNPALLDPIGGVLTGLAVAGWLASRWGIPWPRLADALAPFFAVLQVALALRAAARGDMFGLPTDAPWGVPLWGAVRHPTQLYWAAGALLILLWVARSLQGDEVRSWPPGGLFWRFAAWSAAWYVFVAGFRGDSPVSPAGWRLDQVAGVLVLAVALFQWRRGDVRARAALGG